PEAQSGAQSDAVRRQTDDIRRLRSGSGTGSAYLTATLPCAAPSSNALRLSEAAETTLRCAACATGMCPWHAAAGPAPKSCSTPYTRTRARAHRRRQLIRRIHAGADRALKASGPAAAARPQLTLQGRFS